MSREGLGELWLSDELCDCCGKPGYSRSSGRTDLAGFGTSASPNAELASADIHVASPCSNDFEAQGSKVLLRDVQRSLAQVDVSIAPRMPPIISRCDLDAKRLLA